jgi:hypothetical protein
MPTTINASPRVHRELGLARRRFTFRDRVNDSAYALAPGSELRVVAALPPLPPSGGSYDVRTNNAGNWVVVLVPGVPMDNGSTTAAGDLDPLGVSGATPGRGRAAAADRARTADQLRRINAANRAAFGRPAQR